MSKIKVKRKTVKGYIKQASLRKINGVFQLTLFKRTQVVHNA